MQNALMAARDCLRLILFIGVMLYTKYPTLLFLPDLVALSPSKNCDSRLHMNRQHSASPTITSRYQNSPAPNHYFFSSSPISARPLSKILSKSNSPHRISGHKPANFHTPSTFRYQCVLKLCACPLTVTSLRLLSLYRWCGTRNWWYPVISVSETFSHFVPPMKCWVRRRGSPRTLGSEACSSRQR